MLLSARCAMQHYRIGQWNPALYHKHVEGKERKKIKIESSERKKEKKRIKPFYLLRIPFVRVAATAFTNRAFSANTPVDICSRNHLSR